METRGLIQGFRALDGCNCLSASLRRILCYHGFDLSEDILLGLGAGIGFGYFEGRGALPFIGGRANVHAFHTDLGARCGLEIGLRKTASVRKAREMLLESLRAGEPVCLYADMAYLPYLGLPEEAHFGEHAVVAAGYDAENEAVWIADHDPKASGVKKGTLFRVGLDDLARARNSPHRPFPARNRWFVINYARARRPEKWEIFDSIRQACRAMLNPPIRSLGVAGISRAAAALDTMPARVPEDLLRAALHNFYIYIEVGGTGGGLFRSMYARYLQEAAAICGDSALRELGEQMESCARAWTTAATPLRNPFGHPAPADLAHAFGSELRKIAVMESEVWRRLDQVGGSHAA